MKENTVFFMHDTVRKKGFEQFIIKIHNELKNADLIDKSGFFVGNHHVGMRDAIDYFKNKIDSFTK